MTKMAQSEAPNKVKTNFLFANDINNAIHCHLKYVSFKYFMNGLEQLADPQLKVHMRNLCALNGLTFLQECMTAGYDFGWFKKGDYSLIQDAINLLLLKIRPQAIPLVELFGHSDHILCSAIGNSFGDIYEQHLEWAQNSRLNQGPDNIPKDFHKYIGPILLGKL